MRFRLTPPLEVEFPDKVRKLSLGHWALKNAQDKFHELRGGEWRNIYTIINDELNALRTDGYPNLEFISVMMWAAMLDGEPDLKLQDAERLIPDTIEALHIIALLVNRHGNVTEEEGDSDRPLAERPLSNGADSGVSQD